MFSALPSIGISALCDARSIDVPPNAVIDRARRTVDA
jgi:hypothetical protein